MNIKFKSDNMDKTYIFGHKSPDTDTITSITGAIAEGIFDIPKPLLDKALSYLPKHFVSLLQYLLFR